MCVMDFPSVHTGKTRTIVVKVKMKYTCTKIQYTTTHFLSQKGEQCRQIGNYRRSIMLIAASVLTLTSIV